jgi:HEAT repeat protein
MRKVSVLVVLLLVTPALVPRTHAAASLEWNGRALSVTAEQASLAELLQALEQATGVEILGADAVDETVSVQFSDLPLDEALRRLLARVNHLLVEDDSPAPGAPRLSVWILGAGSPANRAPAVRIDQRSPQEQPWGPIPDLATEPDAEMRRWVVKRLAERSDPEAFDALRRALEDPDPGVRQDALGALGPYGRTALEPIKALLSREKSATVRAAGLGILAQVAGDEAAPLLRRMLTSRDSRVRLAAVEALGHADEATAREALSIGLRDTEPAVRMAAMRTLALYVGERAVKDALDQGLIDADEAARVLGSGLLDKSRQSRAPVPSDGVRAPGARP